jgi:CopG family nickel-responsive transcriptional regulator
MNKGVYQNRSKAVSDILRDASLREEIITGNGIHIGTISIVYNHHMRGVLDRITAIEHDAGATIIATMHVHLTHEDCLEVITTKGTVNKIKKLLRQYHR